MASILRPAEAPITRMWIDAQVESAIADSQNAITTRVVFGNGLFACSRLTSHTFQLFRTHETTHAANRRDFLGACFAF
jgi:hypothetical protein